MQCTYPRRPRADRRRRTYRVFRSRADTKRSRGRSSKRDERSWLPPENGDALDAPLRRCLLSASGDESVIGVCLEMLDLQTRALDHLAIILLLRGPADAGGPEIGVTDHVLGQRQLGYDVGDCQSASAFEQARRLLKYPQFVGRQVDD